MNEKMLAFHYDMKRPMWSPAYIEKLTRRLKDWGYNTIIYEIEDKLKFSGHPVISHPEALSHEETARFVASIRKKGLDVIPCMQTLGHLEFILEKDGYEKFREVPEVHDQVCPRNDDARSLIVGICDEIIDVCKPRQFFHVGADETRALGRCPRCAEYARTRSLGELYVQHMLPIFDHIHSRGLRPIIWADILLAHPEVIETIPEYVVMMDWDYTTGSERLSSVGVWTGMGRNSYTWKEYQELQLPEFKTRIGVHAVDARTEKDGSFRAFFHADTLRAMGFEVITASANKCAGDTAGIPKNSRHLPNVFHSVRKGTEAAAGHLVTSWAVRRNHPEAGMVGAFTAPWALKTQAPYNLEDLVKAFTLEMFGVEMPEFAEAMQLAEKAPCFSESKTILLAREELREGADPVQKRLAGMDSRKKLDLIAEYEEQISGFERARKIITAMREKAEKNKHNLDFWIEGVNLVTFYAEFFLAALRGELEKRAPDLLVSLRALRAYTCTLWEECYTPISVKEELAARYGFHEEYLHRQTAGKLEVKSALEVESAP